MGKNGRRFWLVLAACLVTSGILAGETKRTAQGQKPLSPAGEAALAAHLKDAFDAGRVMGAQHLQEALKQVDLARQVAPGDPRLKYEKQKLTVQKPPAKANKKAPAAQKHEFSLKSYVPLDFDAEKRHVLASFSPPANEKGDASGPVGK